MDRRARIRLAPPPAGVPHHQRALVERAAQGDVEAFERLLHGYHDRLYLYAQAHLGPAAAEEILPDVYLAAWHRLGSVRWDDRAGMAGWLFAVARLTVARRRKHGTPSTPRVALRVVCDPAPGVEGGGRGRAESSASRLGALRRRPREVLILRAVVGLTTREVAAATGWSHSLVKRLEGRAVAKVGKESLRWEAESLEAPRPDVTWERFAPRLQHPSAARPAVVASTSPGMGRSVVVAAAVALLAGVLIGLVPRLDMPTQAAVDLAVNDSLSRRAGLHVASARVAVVALAEALGREDSEQAMALARQVIAERQSAMALGADVAGLDRIVRERVGPALAEASERTRTLVSSILGDLGSLTPSPPRP